MAPKKAATTAVMLPTTAVAPTAQAATPTKAAKAAATKAAKAAAAAAAAGDVAAPEPVGKPASHKTLPVAAPKAPKAAAAKAPKAPKAAAAPSGGASDSEAEPAAAPAPRALSDYNKFMKMRLNQIKAERAGEAAERGSAFKEVAAEWKAMTPAEKADACAAAREYYDGLDEAERAPPRPRAPKKAPGAPKEKRAPSVFNLFVAMKVAQLKEENPDMEQKLLLSTAATAWSSMGPEEKAEAGAEARAYAEDRAAEKAEAAERKAAAKEAAKADRAAKRAADRAEKAAAKAAEKAAAPSTSAAAAKPAPKAKKAPAPPRLPISDDE